MEYEDYEEDFEQNSDGGHDKESKGDLNQDLVTDSNQQNHIKKGAISEERIKLIASAEKYIQKIAEKHPSKAIERSVAEARKILGKNKSQSAIFYY